MSTTIRVRSDDDLPTAGQALVRVHSSDGYPVEGVADPKAWLNPPGLLRSWVAEMNGAVVGQVSVSEPRGEGAVTLWLEDTRGDEDDIAVLGRLFVLREARGNALGERLTRAAMEYAADIGRRLVLDVMEKDRAAIRLYERLGWERIGVTNHSVEGAPDILAYCYVAPQNPRA
jgi:ribosomal protein S18 acetylase RimI-like enzyme